MSVPDAGNFLAFAALAVAPLLALGAVVWALPVVDWIGTLPNWSIALAIITVELGYFVGVVWMWVVKVPLIPYRRAHRDMAKRFTGLLFLAGIIASIAWFVFRE